MVASDDNDELFDVRNHFHIGDFQQCINEAQFLNPSTIKSKIERDVFLYRSYIAQHKYALVLEEIKESSPPQLQSVRSLADYFHNFHRREEIVRKIGDKFAKGRNFDECFLLIAATIYLQEEDIESALRCLHSTGGKFSLVIQSKSIDTYKFELIIKRRKNKIVKNCENRSVDGLH